jgi:hypothetical protein
LPTGSQPGTLSDMNFENLPADWPTIPLTDPDHIADVLDIFVGRRDRVIGSLLILICDEQRRPVQPIVINDVTSGGPRGNGIPLALVADQVAELRPDATVLCAVARSGHTRVTKADRRWARSLERAFAGRLELLGVHLITLGGTLPIAAQLDDAA